MSASVVYDKIRNNDKSMAGNLASAEDLRRYGCTNGIRGAARFRRGVKKGTNAARRRYDKTVIEECTRD